MKITAVPGTTRESAVTVSVLNESTKQLVESQFGQFWIKGEISNFKPHQNGHWYFNLRDRTSQISCVVWSKDQQLIPAAPDEGMQIVALAELTVFPARGQLQLKISRMEAAGDGLWRKAMEQTIARLKADGLMEPGRKRALPRYPRVIAVVTSTHGAAMKDILSVAQRRRPGIRIVVASCAVQGDNAPAEICAAIQRVVRWKKAQVLIVGRGGGSREDLWAFNNEKVARAIAACPIPVISAVGHEIDATVCDLVADYRAATPSAAAEMAVPSLDELVSAVQIQEKRLVRSLTRRIGASSSDLRSVARHMKLAATRSIDRRRSSVSSAAGRLNVLSPLATLSRGYAVARDAEGTTMSSVQQFEEGKPFELLLRDGSVEAEALRIDPKV
ncbi:MAG: exodeoxyribonuclease VII large subunit [Gemmatimonadaceae bacterium]